MNEIKRIEKYEISEIELMGILKDMLLNKKINGIAWTGNYLNDKDKSKAFPIGVQFWIGENRENDLVIQITDDGFWEVDNETIKSNSEVLLSEASDYQLAQEVAKRSKSHGK